MMNNHIKNWIVLFFIVYLSVFVFNIHTKAACKTLHSYGVLNALCNWGGNSTEISNWYKSCAQSTSCQLSWLNQVKCSGTWKFLNCKNADDATNNTCVNINTCKGTIPLTKGIACGNFGCMLDMNCIGYLNSTTPYTYACDEIPSSDPAQQRCIILCPVGTILSSNYCSCVSSATPTPTPTRTPTPTPTRTPTPTPTRTPTPTPISTPICAPVNLIAPLTPIYPSENATYKSNPSIQLNTFYRKAINNSNIFFPNIFFPGVCEPDASPTTCVFPSTYTILGTQTITWTHNYQYCNNTYQNQCSPICTTFGSFNISQYPSFLITTKGNAYVASTINMSKFPLISSPSKYFATYSFSTGASSSSFFGLVPTSAYLSEKKYIAFGYNDFNKFIIENLKNLMLNNDKFSEKPFLLSQTFSPGIFESTKNLYNFGTNDLTISSVSSCPQPAIFLVKNLSINANLTNRDLNSGCVFVVSGTTTIANNVAEVNAFIITNDFITAPGTNTNKLFIKGGLIVTNTNSFDRNINYGLIQSTIPSEEIEYEGARYIKIFKETLQEPINISIKETQYNK